MNHRAIVHYVLLALGVSWALQIAAIAVFGLDSKAAMAVFLCVMWSPTLIALGFIWRHPGVRAQVLWRLGRAGVAATRDRGAGGCRTNAHRPVSPL